MGVSVSKSQHSCFSVVKFKFASEVNGCLPPKALITVGLQSIAYFVSYFCEFLSSIDSLLSSRKMINNLAEQLEWLNTHGENARMAGFTRRIKDISVPAIFQIKKPSHATTVVLGMIGDLELQLFPSRF